MRGEIIKIDPIKKSKHPKDEFIRIHFKLENKQYAKMDLVLKFRNFRRWRGMLRAGNIIDNLELRDKETVSGDSFPYLRERPDLSLEDEQLMELSKKCL